jgi:hypothetical protein
MILCSQKELKTNNQNIAFEFLAEFKIIIK